MNSVYPEPERKEVDYDELFNNIKNKMVANMRGAKSKRQSVINKEHGLKDLNTYESIIVLLEEPYSASPEAIKFKRLTKKQQDQFKRDLKEVYGSEKQRQKCLGCVMMKKGGIVSKQMIAKTKKVNVKPKASKPKKKVNKSR